MTKQPVTLLAALTALIVVCVVPQTAAASQFWSQDIEYALAARTGFLEQIGLTDKDFLSARTWVGSQKHLFEERLSTQHSSQSPWYFYLSGLIDDERSGAFYGQALIQAASDPGTQWLLSLEFIRNNQLQWAANSMASLEKAMFSLGGTTAPLIAQQLLLAGRGFESQSAGQAEFCYAWAKRFDSQQYWSQYQRGRLRGLAGFLPSVSALVVEAWGILSTSWKTQLTFAAQTYRFLHLVFFIFICAVFLVLSLKHLPSGVHFLGDRLYGSAPPLYRTISGIIIVLSLFSIGFFTAVWITAFLIRRFLNSGEKKLLTFACILLALAPIDNWITNMFLQNARAESTAVVFDRVNREGFSEELHLLSLQNAQKKPDNYLRQLSLAISAMKGAEYDLSAAALRKALQLAPQEPVTLLCAGNISFLLANVGKSNFEAVEQYYNDLLKKQPKNTEAIFNLGQAQLRSSGFAAANLIDEAARLEPVKVNNFIKLNELYFSGDSPPLRKLMQPYISPLFFWGKMFFAETGTLSQSRTIWGNTFWGFDPAASLAIFVVLLLIMLIVDKIFWSSEKLRLKRYFTCKICGQLICRGCRKGMMCASCYRKSINLHNSAAMINNLQKEHQDIAALYRRILKCILGSVVPGSEKLYGEESVLKPAIIMFFSSVILGAYFWAFTFHSSYPELTILSPVYLVAVFFVYNIFAVIRNVRDLAGFLIAKAKAKK